MFGKNRRGRREKSGGSNGHASSTTSSSFPSLSFPPSFLPSQLPRRHSLTATPPPPLVGFRSWMLLLPVLRAVLMMFHHWREIWSGQIETTPIWPFVPKQLCFSPFGSDSLVRLELIILLGRLSGSGWVGVMTMQRRCNTCGGEGSSLAWLSLQSRSSINFTGVSFIAAKAA